ncbi:MAG: DUF4416 family protein [Desulfobacterales bacterium]
MSLPRPAPPATLVIGMLLRRRGEFPAVAAELAERFGSFILVSPWMDFDYTSYYTAEMGAPLSRRVLAFERLVVQEALPEIKLAACALEARRSRDGRRTVNLDPGLIVPERFVLATGKPAAHRIYLGSGIYADLALIYREGGFRALPWTYPDYAAEPLRGFLEAVRARYLFDRKEAAWSAA